MTATHQPSHTETTLFTEDDLYLFNEGSHFYLYQKLGAHLLNRDGVEGTYFAVWAPNAAYVSVKGDFNDWSRDRHPLTMRGLSGIWEGFLPGVGNGSVYKYHVSQHNGYAVEKADPFASAYEVPPKTASVVWDSTYQWQDAAWMATRQSRQALDAPISIYELHLGSWMHIPEEGRSLSYRELAPKLTDYVQQMSFTHVEFLPITEHPFYGSWGYQTSGYFAPTSRFGTPQDFMYLVDYLHQHNIGVIFDWVPSHFPVDQHALAQFDGTSLYEHADPREGFHPDWGSFIFNYGRHEVRSFLISSAFFWLETCHIDGLRVDAVASMLYRDYSREEGAWIPNEYGGRENLEAIAFLRRLNEAVHTHFPDVQTIAEESTAYPLVSRPIDEGGLGFDMKWDMGWMHDTLSYFSHDPLHRKYHQGSLTFRLIYAFQENFVLPLSHDEVVHLKGSLLTKMPGDDWQKFANVRSLYGYMYAQAGKKLLFMGGEFGQWGEWNHNASLDWHLLQYPMHQGLQRWVADLNQFYCSTPAMHTLDCDPAGFEWLDCDDAEHSVFTLLRKGKTAADVVLVVCNFTPIPQHNYRVGVPFDGFWQETLNSDAIEYGGSGMGNLGGKTADVMPHNDRPFSLDLTLPPLAVAFFTPAVSAAAV